MNDAQLFASNAMTFFIREYNEVFAKALRNNKTLFSVTIGNTCIEDIMKFCKEKGYFYNDNKNFRDPRFCGSVYFEVNKTSPILFL